MQIISDVPQVSMNSDMMQRLRRDEDTSHNSTSRRKRATSRHAVGALDVGSGWEMERYEDREVADAQFMNMTTMTFKRDLMAQQNKRRVTTIVSNCSYTICTSVTHATYHHTVNMVPRLPWFHYPMANHMHTHPQTDFHLSVFEGFNLNQIILYSHILIRYQ